MDDLLKQTLAPKFPATRYQGSKLKVLKAIELVSKKVNFDSVVDLFGGTGSVAYMFKKHGKQVTYNDHLHFNYLIGKALIENGNTQLSETDLEYIRTRHKGIKYPDFIESNFHDIYFTDEENRWLDTAITNIASIDDEYKKALAYFCVFQACIIKRPYNLFHRKNLYVRTAEVTRSFGNKTSWDKSFDHYLSQFAQEANTAIFDNGRSNRSVNQDGLDDALDGDLIYIDTPYLNAKGMGVDYYGFYHFLEGLTDYENWGRKIDQKSKHKKLLGSDSPWNKKKTIHEAFEKLFKLYAGRKLLVSYRSDGIPSIEELVAMLEVHFTHVEVTYLSEYKYALSKNSTSKEVLILAY